MSYDLVIKNGTVIDGSGLPRFRADVAVQDGRIASIGRIRDGAKKVVDAEGHVVAPGFIDGHTHMDAQIFWDPLGTCSCWHGITSVVMGNCGFTLAPAAASPSATPRPIPLPAPVTTATFPSRRPMALASAMISAERLFDFDAGRAAKGPA